MVKDSLIIPSNWTTTFGMPVRVPYYVSVSHCPHASAADILGAVLPEELVEGAPVGFAATGHIGMSRRPFAGSKFKILQRI